MTDTPKKTLSITRKPSNTGPVNAPPSTIQRTGKRIIRRDELPQVQRIPAPKPKTPKPKAKRPARKPQPKKQVTPPSDLKARELNDRLNAYRVWSMFQPLALGVEKEVFKLVNDECFPGGSKKVVQKVLRMHTHHALYLQAIQRGGARYQLDGTEEGSVNDTQQQYAAEVMARRLQSGT